MIDFTVPHVFCLLKYEAFKRIWFNTKTVGNYNNLIYKST